MTNLIDFKSKKNISITLTLTLFTVIASLLFIKTKRANELSRTLSKVTPQDISHIEFYKDPIRDSQGLNLPLKNQNEIKHFATLLNTLKRSSFTLRNLKVQEETKIRFLLGSKNPQSIEVKIRKVKSLGPNALVTLDQFWGPLSSSMGQFTSGQFLTWLATLKESKKFADITELKDR